MARCKSLDVLEQTILDSHMETSDSDSDGSGSLIVDLEANDDGEEENIILSSDESASDQVETPVIVNTSVISLDTFNNDSSNEVQEVTETSNPSMKESIKSEFIDPDDVQDLCINTEEEKESSSLNSLPESNNPLVISTYRSNLPSAIPARNDWEGAHNFKIKIICDPSKKSECSVFSEEQNKLYVTKDHPFKVCVSAENVPDESIIKVHAVFKLVEHAYESVQRCPTHTQQDFAGGIAVYEHFVQCFSDTAVYEKDYKTGKLSVSVPFEKTKEGESFSAYLFKLACFSSCVGGINRRLFNLIFTLENEDNIPLGRRTIEAKVCACPMRDYRIETEKFEKIKERQKKIRKHSTDSNNTEKAKYSIVVKDPELYLFLKQMKALYEANAYAAKLKSDT